MSLVKFRNVTRPSPLWLHAPLDIASFASSSVINSRKVMPGPTGGDTKYSSDFMAGPTIPERAISGTDDLVMMVTSWIDLNHVLNN